MELTAPEQPIETSNAPVDGHIHVMPEFYLPKAKKADNSKLLLIIIGSAVFLGVIIVVILYFLRDTGAPASIPSPTITPTVSQEPKSTTSTQPVQETKPADETPTTEESSVVEVAKVPLPPIVDTPLDTDTDQDGLTDLEEVIFGTNAAQPDSDGDTFLDGVEVANLYDPAISGALLEVATTTKIISNDKVGYQFLVPESWSASALDGSGRRMEVLPNGSAEVLSIEVYDNPDRLTVTKWYQDQVGTVNLTNFTSFSNEAGWTGIKSRDGRLVIASLGSTGPGARAFIFVMYYDLMDETTIKYPSIWAMITNSLDILVPKSTVTPTTTTP